MIPLWFLWALASAGLVAAAFAFMGGKDRLLGPLVGPWVGLALVFVVVAVTASVDRWHVSEDELEAAVTGAVAQIDGMAPASSEAVAHLAGERLGREIDVDLLRRVTTEPATAEVRLDSRDVPVVCITGTPVDRALTPNVSWSVASGEC